MAHDHYAEVKRCEGQVHPVDEAIERLLRQGGLRRQIRAATARMLQALGRNRQLWTALEELKVRYQLEREEAYFNLGYEHGAAAGRMQAISSSRRAAPRAARDLAAWVRNLAVEAALSPHLKAATLIEIAWALVLGLDPTPQPAESRRRG